jgi:hypothetical protein
MSSRTTRPLLLAALLGLAAAPAATQPADDCMMALSAIRQPVPKFEDFPAPAESPAKPAPVDVTSDAEAGRNRDQVVTDAAAGPDFAGHMTMIGWDCGSACLDWGVADARSGRLAFDAEWRKVTAHHVADPADGEAQPSFFNLRYRLDSRLLIVMGAAGDDPSRDGVAFLEWTGAGFRMVLFVSRRDVCDPSG